MNALEGIVRIIWFSILKSWVQISIYRAIENNRVFEKQNLILYIACLYLLRLCGKRKPILGKDFEN